MICSDICTYHIKLQRRNISSNNIILIYLLYKDYWQLFTTWMNLSISLTLKYVIKINVLSNFSLYTCRVIIRVRGV